MFMLQIVISFLGLICGIEGHFFTKWEILYIVIINVIWCRRLLIGVIFLKFRKFIVLLFSIWCVDMTFYRAHLIILCLLSRAHADADTDTISVKKLLGKQLKEPCGTLNNVLDRNSRELLFHVSFRDVLNTLFRHNNFVH